MRIQLSILTAIALFVTFLVGLTQPAWAIREQPHRSQVQPELPFRTIADALPVSLTISVTQTPTPSATAIPQTAMLMPTSTPTVGQPILVYVPAFMELNGFNLAGGHVEPCGPTKRPFPSIDAEATSTPAPTATPNSAGTSSASLSPSLSATGLVTSSPSITPSLPVSSTICPPNVYEAALGELLVNSALQQRETMIYNPALTQIAREHAMDMATRDYFGSVDPNGVGPNFRVRQAGYPLPEHYSDELNGNNLETTIAGFVTPEKAWEALSIDGGNTHAIGNHEGYRTQTEYGIGYAFVEGSKHERYWVIIITEPGN